MSYAKGWIPQKPDHRDFKISLPVERAEDLPASFDMRGPFMPPVYDQGQLGSCTANAISAAVAYVLNMKGYKYPFIPSRLFIYFNERMAEGTVLSDSGAALRDGLIVLNKYGVCPESDPSGKDPGWWWKYSDDQIHFRLRPFNKCYTDAILHRAVTYEAVPQDANSILTVLASGFPMIFGISVYESFESDAAAKTGIIPMPATSESNLGGHALLAVGYTNVIGGKDMGETYVIFRNSWSEKWGDAGYGYIPLKYLTDPNLGSDYWVIREIGFINDKPKATGYADLSAEAQAEIISVYHDVIKMRKGLDCPPNFLHEFLLDPEAKRLDQGNLQGVNWYEVAVTVAQAICKASVVVCPIVNNLGDSES